MNGNLEKDTSSRIRIVSEINSNFFVEAGAGSGKTTMLVNRMVAMVEHGIDISKICAITFTKAAAGEFYKRFQKLLIERSNPDYIREDKGYIGQLPKPTDATRLCCAEALQNIDLCFMGTIDSFCGMILSEHPSEAGIPSDATLISDLDAQAMYKQIYVKICAGEYGKDLRRLAMTFQSFQRNPEEVFVKCMTFLMDNRNVHFNYKEMLCSDLDVDYASEKAELIHALECILNHEEIVYFGAGKDTNAWGALQGALKVIRKRWSINYSNIVYALKSIHELRLLPVAEKKHVTSLGGQCEPGGAKGNWLELRAFKSGGIYEKLININYCCSMTFMNRCVPIIEESMRSKGNLTYFDYLYYLRNMLRRDADSDGNLIRYIYDRHSYFLIDEFQDTNPLQAEVFFYLSSEKPVAQWSACVPRPGSLFIVGDPKQSIYRFRSADVTSFLKVKKLFETTGGDILYLTRNFRSTKMMCAYFNKVFAAMLPQETEVQSKFEDIPLPDKETAEFQGIFMYPAMTGSAALEYPDQSDPVQIGKIITRLVNNPLYNISSDNNEEPRRIKYSDFMVITAGKAKLAPIMTELDRLEIPLKVEGKVPFEDNEALKEVYRIYQCVACPLNKMAVYGALVGKLIGFVRGDMITYKSNGGELILRHSEKVDEITDVITRSVTEKINFLYDLSIKAIRLSPAALFSEIIEHFKIYEYITTENMEILYYSLELIRSAEKANLLVSLKDGADYIRTLIDGKTDEERCLSLNKTIDCVHMANLHKVKGLEAPIVILAASANPPMSVSYRVKHGDNGSEGYLFSLEEKMDNGRSSYYFETTDYVDEKEDEKAALTAENQRLIYVAATRARNALIICDSMYLNARTGGVTHNAKWMPIMMDLMLPDIFHSIDNNTEVLMHNPKVINATDLYNKAIKNNVFHNRMSEVATYTIHSPSLIRTTSKLVQCFVDESHGETQSVDDRVNKSRGIVSDVFTFPTLLGTMVHRLLEILVVTRNKTNVSQTINEIVSEYLTPVSKPYEKQFIDVLKKIADRMRNGGYEQNNGAPKDILHTLLSADEVYCEVPFSYRELHMEESGIWNGVMDVIYRDDKKWHIIDYKTNIDGNDLDMKYQYQLQAYRTAFRVITGEDADALIYHINTSI